MAIKIERINNYFKASDTVTGQVRFQEPVKDVSYRENSDNVFTFNFFEQNWVGSDYTLSDFVDSNGDPFADLAALRTFLTLNTGFNTALGGSGAYHGVLDYEDVATKTTPISVTGNWTYHKLTNDGAGDYTNKLYAPLGVTDVWDTTNNQFDFTQLKLGDAVTIRIALIVTTANNFTDIDLDLFFGVGVSEYEIHMVFNSYKDSGIYELTATTMIYMGNDLTLNNPGEVRIKSDGNMDVEVTGWAIVVHQY